MVRSIIGFKAWHMCGAAPIFPAIGRVLRLCICSVASCCCCNNCCGLAVVIACRVLVSLQCVVSCDGL